MVDEKQDGPMNEDEWESLTCNHGNPYREHCPVCIKIWEKGVGVPYKEDGEDGDR